MLNARRLTGAAILLTGVFAACTPASSPGPTGPAATSGVASPGATGAASPSAVAATSAATPAATTTAPTAAASPAATSGAASPASSPAAAGQVAFATFAPKAGSSVSVSGAATLIDSSGATLVVIGVVQSGTDPIAAAIQEGTCAAPNPLIKFPLTEVIAGASITSVDVPVADLLATDHVVNLFVAGSETESSLSCGDIQPLPAVP